MYQLHWGDGPNPAPVTKINPETRLFRVRGIEIIVVNITIETSRPVLNNEQSAIKSKANNITLYICAPCEEARGRKILEFKCNIYALKCIRIPRELSCTHLHGQLPLTEAMIIFDVISVLL